MSQKRGRQAIKAAFLGGAAAAGLASGLRARRERRLEHAAGLSGSMTIRRDQLGVPHIIAGSREDAMFGFGFSIAEDRLWQMDINRRVASGTLSQVIGPDALESDRLMRLLGMSRIAHQMVRHMSDEEWISCEHFAAGVNHFIDNGPLPAEFRILRYRPAQWEPADSAAVFRLLAWTLSGSPDADLTAEQVRNAVGQEWANVIYRGGFADHEPMIREHARSNFGPEIAARRLPIFPQFGASNAWAVSPERSATGGALLANDPHLELRNPSIWGEVRIEAPGFRVAGMTVPGIPAVVIGRTPDIAWGVTAGLTPQVYLYSETLQDDVRFAEGGDWQPIRTHDEIIPVKGKPNEILTIRYTPRGPLYSDLVPQPGGQAVSIHWAGMEEGHELGVLLGAVTSTTIKEMLPRIGGFTSPPLNVVTADGSGNIATMSMGKMAVRSVPPGLLPPGEFPPKYVASDDMPLELNPERGWIACANNRLIDDAYSHNIYGNWDPGFRYRRIIEDLTSRARHSPADFRNLQLDVYSVHAAEIAPMFVSLLEGTTAPWVVEDLRDWDYCMSADSRPALLFEAINHEWTRLALGHRLPGHVTDRVIEAGGALSVPVLFVDRVLRGELPAWMDDDDRARLVSRAVDQALAWLTRELGPDMDGWRWGDLLQLTFKHPLGRMPGPHRRFVNVGPFSVSGSRHTISPMVWHAGKPFEVMAGASFRYVTDLKRPEQSWISNTLGQSGSPFSRHYRDQSRDFLGGLMHNLWPQGFPPRGCRTIHPSDG